MNKNEQFKQIEAGEEPSDSLLIPLDETEELREFFHIFTTTELDLF